MRSAKLAKLLLRFRRDARGNFAVILSVMLLPMIGMMGLAIDYSMRLRYKTALDASADAAALAGVTEASSIINQQTTPFYDPTPVAVAYGQMAGSLVFNANAAPIVARTSAQYQVTVQRMAAPLNNTLQSVATYTAASQNSFGKIFGAPQFRLSGSATATYTLPRYMDVYVLVDTSQSMGIAATQADMNKLSGLTGGCVFGCHVLQSGQTITNEQVAHNNNVTLRIDVIRSAIQSMVATAKSMNSGVPYIRFGLYQFPKNITSGDTSAANILFPSAQTPSTALSSNYDALMTAANGLDLGPNDSSGIGDSTFSASLQNFASSPVFETGGDGSGSSSPQTFVFLMTDGVQDIRGNCTDGHCTQAFDPGLCTALKSKKATVGVIYTTYIPFPSEQTYVDLVQPFQSSIAPNLQSCATPGFYYEATDGPAIQTAVQALFAQAVTMARLIK